MPKSVPDASCFPHLTLAVLVLLAIFGQARARQADAPASKEIGAAPSSAATARRESGVNTPHEKPKTAAPDTAAKDAPGTPANDTTSAPANDSREADADASRATIADALPATIADAATAPPQPTPTPLPCKRTVNASVAAIAQPFMLNRLGASIPQGLIYALEGDIENQQLKADKRARPLVLRANAGDCLRITFTNRIKQYPSPGQNQPAVPSTTQVSVHVEGMQYQTIEDDGAFVGVNRSSLAGLGEQKVYKLYAEREGTYLLYSLGDADTNGQQIESGLFGAVNVQPEGAEWYRSQVSRADLALANYNAVRLPANAALDCPAGSPNCTLTVTKKDGTKTTGQVVKSADGSLRTPAGQPVVNYDACFPDGRACSAPGATKPILRMLDANNNLVYGDLTAVVTGPEQGRFAGVNGPYKADPKCALLDDPRNTTKVDPLFCDNPALPDRKQPYREITVIYHEVNQAAQAFPVFGDADTSATLGPGADTFAINYGTGGIGAEIYANRVGVGPMGNCVACKYEEFFLSSWTVGDPAMVVDVPANTKAPGQPCLTTEGFESGEPPCAGTRTPRTGDPYTMSPTIKATKAFYPDDPSNVYHSYLNDHAKVRILHGGIGINHVHHQHAGQWLQTPGADQSSFLDSQMINPGSSYSLEMVNGGSGNLNKTAGDWLFHCHFYPHFAAGMWGVWRVHDVFEEGTALDSTGRPAAGARALPDGEIIGGTPIPAVVPLPTLAMAPRPSLVHVSNGRVCYGAFVAGGSCDTEGRGVTENPGFPFFIPGVAGLRAPHPPLDFAPVLDPAGNPVPGQFLDGGLPRHLVTSGTIAREEHSATDWTKDLGAANAVQLPEEGTPVERVAMKYHGTRNHPSFAPDGTPAAFVTNGLPRGPQRGAPYADPGVDADGNPVGGKPRRYQGAALELDVVFNKSKWHYAQQRILALWKDVVPTLDKRREPEPLFFRANTGELIEFWHTNLVPNYYEMDAFQVRTPTDIIGQHIHLVKFDVTSSDGAANGFNYEDGTFSPEEVQELVAAINQGSWKPVEPSGPTKLTLKPPPADIIRCPADCSAATGRCKQWCGAQTTVQRWYSAPLLDNAGTDRTASTAFTHDHFGPSTHQQAGLYGGLLIEPAGSKWLDSETGQPFGTRSDGGPTSWKADIIAGANGAGSFREFALEFQDFQLAYDGQGTPVNAPPAPVVLSSGLVRDGTGPGTMSLNYRNEPVPTRVNRFGDLSRAFDSTYNPAKAINPSANVPDNGDPMTPLMRAYENDPVKVRLLVGAHSFGHFFTIHGMRWLYEPAWKNSGYKTTQPMGLSEHFELNFNAPPSSAAKISRPFTDYLYSASSDDLGLNNGLWGIFRAYVPTKPAAGLKPLPNNPVGPSVRVAYATCPANLPAAKVRNFDITATTAQKALPAANSPTGGSLVFNDRGLGRAAGSPATAPPGLLGNPWGLLYVNTADLDAQGRLKPGAPVEPLILRAAAGDCVNVTLRNALDSNSAVLKRQYQLQAPFDQPLAGGGVMTLSPSARVGIQPQLLSFDAASSYGLDVGYNGVGNTAVQLAAPGATAKYQWYAGITGRDRAGAMTYNPVEFGSLNLLPADPLLQHINGLYGAMVVEPESSTWTCDGKAADGTSKQVDCWPSAPTTDTVTSRAAATVTAPGAQAFREFVVLINEDVKMLTNADYEETRSAVNYRAEPTFYRFGNWQADNFPADRHCSLSNALVRAAPTTTPTSTPTTTPPPTDADPRTPVFTAAAGTPVRFRVLHPPGAGLVQTFTVHGHLWQRNPFVNNSKSIGDNKLSQWTGSVDNVGSTTHNEIVIGRAGGAAGAPGDYLYTTFVPAKSQFGLWGIFRVLNADGTVASVSAGADCAAARRAAETAPTPPAETGERFRKRLERFRKQPGTKDGKPLIRN